MKEKKMTFWKKSMFQLIKTDTYEVEPELRMSAKQYAEFYLKRYEIEPTGHWPNKEKRTNYIGQIGQTAFFLILQQFYVPSDPNFPIIDWRGNKPYDYNVPNFGTVEVKTEWITHRKLQIKSSEWHGEDYVVAFQFADPLPEKLRFRGWLSKEQVESLPYYEKGETGYNPLAACYMTDLIELNPPIAFLEILIEQSLNPKEAKKELERIKQS